MQLISSLVGDIGIQTSKYKMYWDSYRQAMMSESILGLNDYLTTVVPNLHQMSRSNLVQLKNKTMKWLSDLPNETQTAVIDMAAK